MIDRQAWTLVDDRILVRMVSEGRRNTAIAAVLGRTVMSVATRSHHLRDQGVLLSYAEGRVVPEPVVPDLRPGKPRQSHSTWTKLEDMEVLSMTRRGRSSKESGLALGRGAGSTPRPLLPFGNRRAGREKDRHR